ncbi:TRAP transporter substrate-binding protein, partial [Alphaproteobacteria bacterium]|nr:TRAP transporter substrate-binding protein [Alphaproteobacteria bacterium]
SLGLGEKDLLEGCALGTVDAAGTAYSGTREFDLFYSPYFFRDAAHSLRVANGPLYEPTRKALAEKYSCHFLGVGRAGPWNLFLRDDLKSFDGLKGRKIRAAQIEGQLKGLKHLGAEPVPIAFNELYGALKSGIVDGCGTLASLAIPMKFYEVCKYIARNDFGMGLDKFWVSSRVWNSWSKKNQNIVQESFLALEPIVYAKRVQDEMDPQYKRWEEINGAGTVLNLDSTAAQKKMAPVNEALANEVFGAGAWSKIEKA